MSTSLITLMQRVLEGMGQYRALSVTTGGSASVITDTKLRRYIGAADVANDRMWVYWTEIDLDVSPPAAANQKRLITDSTTTTATMESALSFNTTAGDTYLLTDFDPDFIKVAINRAGQYLFGRGLYLPVRDESLIVDNLLTNPSFVGTFSSNTVTGWTRGGSATVTAETTIVRDAWAAQSAKMVGTVAADGLYQAPQVNQHEMTGRSALLVGHVYATVADIARLRINWDDTNYESHAYHSGEDRWEFQKILVSIPTTATKVEARCSSEGTAYFNKVALCIDPIYRYTLPSNLIRGPYRIEQQRDEKRIGLDAPFEKLSRYNHPVRGRTLRIHGKGAMTTLSADADSLEVSNDQVQLIVARAIHELYMVLAGSPSNQRDHYLIEAERWDAITERYLAQGKQHGPVQTAAIPWGWKVEESGETRFLVLDGYRG